MTNPPLPSHIAFDGYRRLAAGPLPAVALAIKRAVASDAIGGAILIFDNATGRSIDIDTRGSDDEVAARYAQAATPSEPADANHETASDAASTAGVDPLANGPRGRGRPKLGVVAREVTLLPRHWEWLATQRGGASVALRRLVDEARRSHAHKDRSRRAQERAYHFMSAIAGDMPGFEEASRALFANDGARLRELIAGWPADVRDHALALASPGDDAPSPGAR